MRFDARRPLAGLLAVLACTCAGPAPRDGHAQRARSAASTVPEASTAPDSDPRWRELATSNGDYRIEWCPEPDPIPLNESFELLVRLRDREGELVRGAIVVVRGFMPGHGHGMLRDPRSEELGDGLYRVRGMLLHMTGHWEIRLDVIVGGRASSTSFDLELE